MSQPSGTLYEIRWHEICPWLILVRGLRVSLLVRVLLLAFAGVLITQWGWSVIDQLFTNNPLQLPRLTDSSLPSPAAGPALIDPAAAIRTAEQASTIETIGKHFWAGPLVRGWSWLSQPFVRLASGNVSWRRCFLLSLSGIWAIGVWSIFGGAVSRIAALYLTRGELLGPIAALRAAVLKAGASAGSPLIALLGATALSVPLILLGLLIRFDFLALFAGLAWVLVLAWGLMLAVVLLGLLFGWPLMWATVGVERTDAFDGVSRCYAYLYQRPLQWLFYIGVATVLGWMGEAVVHGFAQAAITLAEWTVSWGAGNQRVAELVHLPAEEAWEALGGLAASGAGAIGFWKWTLTAIAASFPLAYLWSATVGIYLLLRRHVDSTEMDEIALDQREPQQGLPPLETDETGVPAVQRPADSDSTEPKETDDS